MVERAAISIFAMAFIYFFNMTPYPHAREASLTKPAAVSLLGALSWPGAPNCGLPSRRPTQLCWDWFLPHRKLKRKSELGQKTASLIKSPQLWLLPLFSSLLLPCPLVPVDLWSCGSSHSGPTEVVASTCGHSSMLWLWYKCLAPDQLIKQQ